MQIREIHIEGFGIFAKQHITGLTSGLNVILGANEAGKTTLMEFIRRILFGCPRKGQGVNPYPALNGGVHGGRLICQTTRGEAVSIDRVWTPRDKVTVTTGQESREGQAALDELLGHASANLYKNIYAFSLDELQSFNSLNEDEIKHRLYGTELGLGNISLKAVEKDFNDRCDDLFKPRASTKIMNALLKDIKTREEDIREIQKGMKRYGELTGTLEKLEKENAGLEKELQSLASRKRELETQKDLFGDVSDLSSSMEELDRMEDISRFPENGLQSLELIKVQLRDLKKQLEEEESALKNLEIDRAALSVNEFLLARESDVVVLQQSTKSVQSAIQDQVKVQQEKSQLEEQIRGGLRDLGEEWTEERVLALNFNQSRRNEVQTFQETLSALDRETARARDQLDYHREQRAAELSTGWNVPGWLKIFSSVLTAISLGGLAWGWGVTNVPLMAGSALVLVVSLLMLFMTVTQNRAFLKEDLKEKDLRERLKRAQDDREKKREAWRTWLAAAALNEELQPAQTEKLGSVIREIQGLIRQRSLVEQRIREMRESEEAVIQRIRNIETTLDGASLTGDIPANIEIIHRLFDKARENRDRKLHLAQQIGPRTEKIGRLKKSMRDSEQALDRLIQKAGARDEEDFRRKHALLEKRRALIKHIGEKRGLIESRVGLGALFGRFIETLQETSPDTIHRKLEEVTSQLKDLTERKDQRHEEIGAIRKEIEQLANNDDLLVKQGDLEIAKQKLRRCGREWAASKLALTLLKLTRNKYEKERQPAVVQAAERVFTQITAGNYRKIFKPLDSEEVRIVNGAGRQKALTELSRGTREQLYLSMRFGLIEEYESRSEPLPIIMDDVFVNFDDARKSRMMELLPQFAASRQIIVLTCHQSSFETYLRAGATEIRLPS
ncbi:MAG: AAA family ATPase [Nitrospinaceae bacterium]